MTDITIAAVFDAILQNKTSVIVLWSQKSNVASSAIALNFSLYAPGITALSKDPELTFLRVDVDTNADLAMKYSIRAVPTIMLFVKGQVVVSEVTQEAFLSGIKQWIV